ncbi:hypothetical protein AGMMS50262_04840 [Bacteroidia bacterium]|nr:hypothetical protein AGMMS50262_04840 [Bacteroidia bacterium]
MKKTKYILSSFILLMIAIACVDKAEVYDFPEDKYFYEIPDVPVTEDYVVGVRYNTMDSGYWFDKTKKQTEYYTGHPELDLYGDPVYKYFHRNYSAEWPFTVDQTVSGVLEQHLKWGKQAGIDFFVFGWGGKGWNDTLLMKWEQLYAQDHAYPKVVIRFDPNFMYGKVKLAEVPGTNDTLMKDPFRMDTLRYWIDSIYNHVLAKDFNYHGKDGKPVMIINNFVNKPGEITDLKTFINEFRARNNNNIWLMGELPSNRTSPEMWGYRDETTKGVIKGDSISPFDALYIENITTGSFETWNGYYSFLDFNYNYWKERTNPRGTEYIPTIFPAYDNKVRQIKQDNQTFFDGDYVIARWKKDTNVPYVISAGADYQSTGEPIALNLGWYKDNPYKILANVAKRNVGQSRIVMIYSWNDFRNGNNLEPMTEFGTEYLDYTKEFFKKK